MKTTSGDALNRLTREFYEQAADQFSETRQAPWQGWLALLEHLRPSPDPLRVLDVGCGNARFGLFLERHLGPGISYTGTDVSQPLLEHARQTLPRATQLLRHDFTRSSLSSALEGECFDLVSLFGIFHHVYGHAARVDLLRDASSLVRPGGVLAFSLWQWKLHPRLSMRIEPWPTESRFNLGPADVRAIEPEEDDYLLRWGKEGQWVRYCHHFSDDEARRMETALDWECLSVTQGEGGLNRYIVLRSPSTDATIEPESDGDRI